MIHKKAQYFATLIILKEIKPHYKGLVQRHFYFHLTHKPKELED